MKTHLYATCAALAVLCAHRAYAEVPAPVASAPTPDAAGAEAANPVSELIVTAARGPQDPAKVGASVTVLNAAAIQARQQVLVSDLISRTPGVAYSRNGGPGGVTTIRIRGAEGDQTVAVVDGVKINDPSAPGGGYNFANLLTGEVARIEVLRGAQSTLWGSQAIGGVVNIVTAEPTEALEGGLQAEAGGARYLRGAAGGRSEHLVWRLAASRHETDGASAYRLGTERDGYRQDALSGRARVIVSEALSLDLRAVWSKNRNDFDGFPAPAFSFADTAQYGEIEETVGYAGLNLALLDGRLKNRLAVGYTRSASLNFNPAQAVTPLTFDGTGINRRVEYQGAFAITSAWSATFGAEAERASMRTRSPSAFSPNPAAARARAQIDSLYAQLAGDLGGHLSVTVGLRRDHHDTFGDHSTGQVSGAWRLNDGATVVRASFGQGFKAPTLYQLYSQYGNLGLRPESADSYDFGVEQRVGVGSLSVTGFARETENQIDFVSCASGSLVPACRPGGVARFGYYDNIARTQAHGVELSGLASVGPLTVDANYTWTHTENDAAGNPNRGKQLARRPEHQANLAATYRWGSGLSATADIRYVGASFDTAANTYVLQSFTLLDLRASYPVSEAVEVYGRVENVFDDDYETARNYGTLGRTATLGVRAKF